MSSPFPFPSPPTSLHQTYPWTRPPLLASAPMRLIATAPLATAVTLSAGIGFIGAGNDISTLDSHLQQARVLLSQASQSLTSTQQTTLPVGVGFITWGVSLLEALPILQAHRPCAVWLFAPPDSSHDSLRAWTTALRFPSSTTGSQVSDYRPQIWIQVGSVAEALGACVNCAPDVVVVQGGDAGGHGLSSSASVVSLVPEVRDALQAALDAGQTFGDAGDGKMPSLIAAGGIVDGRGVAAALALGADGVCMGTRYLAAQEAVLPGGYRKEVLRAIDGGQTTVRSKVYDTLRGTTGWPDRYGGRGVTNASFDDALSGMNEEENKRLYLEAIKLGDDGWGPSGRMTTYAGTAVGLVRKVQTAKEITEEVRDQCRRVVDRLSIKL